MPVGYTQLSALYVDLATAKTAGRGAGNESGVPRVVKDEPIGRPEAKIALDHQKFASGKGFWTSFRMATHMPQLFAERNHAFAPYSCVRWAGNNRAGQF